MMMMTTTTTTTTATTAEADDTIPTSRPTVSGAVDGPMPAMLAGHVAVSAPVSAPVSATTSSSSPSRPRSPPPARQGRGRPRTPEGGRQVAEARAAVVASIGNMLDAELQSRAAMLHRGAAALDRQQREVAGAADGLRRETDKLAREADAAARRLKELGNVQNWAEVLERRFLVLEETARLAAGGADQGDEDDGFCSACSSCCSGQDDGDPLQLYAAGHVDVRVDGQSTELGLEESSSPQPSEEPV